eukprot:TRINITY_DN9289_c0_g1_i1.p1 TRINITY_DN9289_c0_g1~~TRINITY_DN9289_c0_g1_i1.p1  ORF type:complete len:131 (+),score=29.44 TRINITY_DN9289_c0_g1_i1:58-450(+)
MESLDLIKPKLEMAEADLRSVSMTLHSEFAARGRALGGESFNIVSLLERIERLAEQVPELQKQCSELVLLKQDAVDTSKEVLLHNRSTLVQLKQQMRDPVLAEHEDTVCTDFKDMCNLYTKQAVAVRNFT